MTQDLILAYTRRITMANKTQMITILYEMVLDYISEGEKKFEEGDEIGFTEELTKSMNCIDELCHSLNLNYELGRNLLGLYIFEKGQLVRAIAKKSKENLNHVKKTFDSLHESYLKLEEQNKEEALMTNVPKVYVGLTYGKSQLTESVSDNYTSRGYMA